MKRELQFAVILTVLFFSMGSSLASSHAQTSESETWTFMVYSCADCDLEGYQLGYFWQMAYVGSTADVNIVVQMDRIPGEDSSYGDWTDCKRFYITQGLTPASENAVASLGEANMGDWRTLADFLIWAIQGYQADHYFAMIIGHGWIDGVCPDWTNDDILTPLEIRQALTQVKDTTKAKIDIIGIEGCQQAALEIAYEIGDCADLIIASEDVSTSWPYRYILTDLVSAQGTKNSTSVATMIVDYFSQYSRWTGGDIMALSTFNLTRIKTEVAPATTGLADTLIANITRYAQAIARAASRTESHAPIYDSQEAESCRDLYDFATKIRQEIQDPSVQLAGQKLIYSIEDACEAEWHARRHPYFHGLYLYLPDTEEIYDARSRIYGQSYSAAHPLWIQDSSWGTMLHLLFETYARGLGSREQVVSYSSAQCDTDMDTYSDALQVTLNVSTTGSSIGVTGYGYLAGPDGVVVDRDNSTWTTNSTGCSGELCLHVPIDGEGLYRAVIDIYDQFGIFEDEIRLEQQFDTAAPVTIHDYDGTWHNSDISINLCASDGGSGVYRTYYRINDGTLRTVDFDGQPLVVDEGSDNKLEYWSLDNAGHEELPHNVLTSIKLDKTSPTFKTLSRIPDEDVLPSQSVNIFVGVSDITSQVENVMLFFATNDTAMWEKTYMNFNQSTGLYEATVPGQEAGTLVTYKALALDYAGNSATLGEKDAYYSYRTVPEFSSLIALSLFMITTLCAVILARTIVNTGQFRSR